MAASTSLSRGHSWDFVVFTVLGRNPSGAWLLPPSLGLGQRESRRLLDRLRRSPHRSLAAGDKLKWLLPALQCELASQTERNLPMAEALAKATLLELDRVVAQARPDAAKERKPRFDPCAALLRQLESEYADNWSLDRMSKVARLGRTRLGELIQEQTGDSPITYLNRVRIAKAQEFLRLDEGTITDTAFACGFQSSQYFARTFKRMTGRSPRVYREAWRKKMHNEEVLPISKKPSGRNYR